MNNDSNKEEIEIEITENTTHVVNTLGSRRGNNTVTYNQNAQNRLNQRFERNNLNRNYRPNVEGVPNGNGNNIGNNPDNIGNTADDIGDKVDDIGNNPNNNLNNNVNNKQMPLNEKLANNRANQKKNLASLLQKRKNKKANESDNNQDSQDTSSSNDTFGDNDHEKQKVSLKKKAKMIRLAISILGPVIFWLFIILVVVAIVGYIGSLFGVVSFGGDDVTSMSDNKNEQKYYEKLDSVVEKYQKSCGITIDKSYLHTILVYPMNNYDEFFGQDFSLENIDDNSQEVDYKSITGQVDNVAKLLVKDCSIDYDVDGSSYNRIKDSSFFEKHYKEALKKADADTILEDVFHLAEVGSQLANSNWFITDNLQVTMGTCEQPYNDKLLNEGTSYSSTVGFSEYIMGVIYGEVGDHNITNETKEFLKAFTLVTSSYVLNRAGYQPGDTEIFVHNGNCWQLSCDIKNGCTYAYDPGEYGTTYTGNVEKNNIAFVKPALPQDKINILKDVFEEVFGMLLLDGNGNIKWADHYNSTSNASCNENCMGQQEAIIDAKNGMTYKEILDKYYDNYTITNAKEGLYADNVSYENGGYNEEVVYYNQNDYPDVVFCGRTSNTSRPGTIKSSGCGTTAMAIILSTLVDKSYNPVAVMEEAYGMNVCGVNISGTSTSFFKKSAKAHDLGYKRVSKSGDLQAVLNALESGNSLVIAHMGPGTFTRSGHYIVLARVNDKGKVYVYDPNKSSRNGWYDFNSVIVKELRGSLYIITKG